MSLVSRRDKAVKERLTKGQRRGSQSRLRRDDAVYFDNNLSHNNKRQEFYEVKNQYSGRRR